MPNLVSLSRPSLQIYGKLRRGYFRISGQSLMKENCHNSGTSDYTDMKLGLTWVTQLERKPKRPQNYLTMTSCHLTSCHVNCDVIVIFPIYGQFGAIWKPDSRRIVCKTYIFINSSLLIQVSGIILTIFRQGVILHPSTLKRTSKEPIQTWARIIDEKSVICLFFIFFVNHGQNIWDKL